MSLRGGGKTWAEAEVCGRAGQRASHSTFPEAPLAGPSEDPSLLAWAKAMPGTQGDLGR